MAPLLTPESIRSVAESAISKVFGKPALAEKENDMLFALILGYALSLLPSIVTGVQKVATDAKDGDTVEQMAHDALAEALAGAAAVFPAGSVDSTLAEGAGVATETVIDTVASVMNHVKSTGAVKSTMAFVEHVATFRKPKL